MDIYVIYTIFLILIIFYIILDNKNLFIKNKMNFDKLNYNKNLKKKIIKKTKINYKPINLNFDYNCKVPTLNTEQCFKSKYHKCSNINGNYSQCTNNNLPNNFNGLCENRTFEMTNPENKISENCYNIMK